MADSDSLAAQCASLSEKLHGTLRELEEMTKKLKNVEADDGDGGKDVNPSHTSFKCACAVQQSRLLSLAPELRNMIWKLCLFHPDDLATKICNELIIGRRDGCLIMTIDPASSKGRPKIKEAFQGSLAKRTKQSMKKHSLRNLALMKTCQDVYNETAPFLWSQRFFFLSMKQLQAFLFSNARLDLVRDIFVLRVDRQCGVNYMPAICGLLADKVKGLERFDIDMSNMDKVESYNTLQPRKVWDDHTLRYENEIRNAGVKVGLDIYSCMYPWVTKVVRDQGIEKLMAVLQISGQKGRLLKMRRTHKAFAQVAQLNANELRIACTAIAGEILRLVNLHDK